MTAVGPELKPTDLYREDLHLECAACWASNCSDHTFPTKVVVKVLLNNYDWLAKMYEEARINLARALGVSDGTDMMTLVAEVRNLRKKEEA